MLTTIGQHSQSMQADAAVAGLMVSNYASRLVTAGRQCMHIWLSSDVPVLARPRAVSSVRVTPSRHPAAHGLIAEVTT